MLRAIPGLRNSLALKISSQVCGPAPAREAGRPLGRAWLYCGVPLTLGWLGLWAADSRWSGRLNYRWVAHFGPFLPPRTGVAGLRQALELLRDEPLLLSTERNECLSQIEAVSCRRAALRQAVKEMGLGFRVFVPVIQDLVTAPTLGQTRNFQQFEASVRIVWDVLSAAPPEERRVPTEVLTALVTNVDDFWAGSPWGEEIRATLLHLLLECPENARAAPPAVVEYLWSPGALVNYDSIYPYKQKLYGHETHDIKRKCLRLIGAANLPGEEERVSPQLTNKLTARSVELLVTGCVLYSMLRMVAGAQSISALNYWEAMSKVRKVALGCLGLEGVYRIEEYVINSEAYFHEKPHMLATSLGMLALHTGLGVLVFRSGYWLVAPFFGLRLFRDPNTDAFRNS